MHARLQALICLLVYFSFFVLKIAHSQNAGTDFDTKYVKRRGSAQECAFSGSQNQNLAFRAFVPPKPFWDPILI